MLGDLKDRCAGVAAVHSALGSPAVRQPVSSMWTASWVRIQSRSASCHRPVRRSRADKSRPRTVDSWTPNNSPASSAIPRREIRLRAVKVTIAARNLGPNADPPIPAGNDAVVLSRTPGCAAMGAMLNQHHADRRQLAYLVTTEPATLTALVHRELAAATTARLR